MSILNPNNAKEVRELQRPEAFIFRNPGDAVAGVVLDYGEHTHDEYGTHRVVTLEVAWWRTDGEVKDATGSGMRSRVHLLHTMLNRGWDEARDGDPPEVGDAVVVTRLEDRYSRARQADYQDYAVQCEAAKPPAKARKK